MLCFVSLFFITIRLPCNRPTNCNACALQMLDWVGQVTLEPAYFLFFLAITLAQSGSGFLYPVKVV